MKRLRDQRGAADPVIAEAARLLSAREPLAEDVARRQRVRARLRRRRAAPRGAMWLRAAAMLLLVCSVAAASAMIGRVAQTIRSHIEAARAAKQREHEKPHHRHAPAPAGALAPVVAPRPLVAPAPRVTPPPLPPHRAPRPAAPAVAADDRESDEQRLLTDAVRALRHQHDPARAEQLLERYLDRYPDGVAAEDALALALEATIGRDAPRAAGFATRYLSRYPSGRWSALAHRALEP